MHKERFLQANDVLAVVYLVSSLLSLNNVYILSSMILTTAMTIFIHRKNLKKVLNSKIIIAIISFCTYIFLSALTKNNIHDSLLPTYSFFSVYFIAIYFYYLKLNKRYKTMLFITAIGLTIMVLNSLRAYILFDIDGGLPIQIAQLKTHNLYLGEIYGLFYANAILSIFLLQAIINKTVENKALRFIAFIVFIILVFSIYKSRSSITLLIVLFSILLVFIFKSWGKNNISLNRTIIILLLFILCIWLIFAKDLIGNILINISHSKSSKLLMRINSLGYILSGKASLGINDSVLDRFSRIFTTLQTFAKYPLFGVNHLAYGDYDLLLNLGVGMHSQWFDTIAQFGVFGSCLYFYIHIYHIYQTIKISNYKHIALWVFTLILLGIVNPLLEFTPIFIEFFAIPSLYIYSMENNDVNLYNS